MAVHQGPLASAASAVTLALSHAPVARRRRWPYGVVVASPGQEGTVSGAGTLKAGTAGPWRSGSGHLAKLGFSSALLVRGWSRAARILSPSPRLVPCPPPAVQPQGLPSHRRCRVSQLCSAACEPRRVLDKAPAGRGGLAGVESPREGKTWGGNTTLVSVMARGFLCIPAPWKGAGAVGLLGQLPATGTDPHAERPSCPAVPRVPGTGHLGARRCCAPAAGDACTIAMAHV